MFSAEMRHRVRQVQKLTKAFSPKTESRTTVPREQHAFLKRVALFLIHGAFLISLLTYGSAIFAAGGAVDDETITPADTPVTIDVLANDVGSLDAVIANYSGPDAALLNNSAIFSLHPTTPTFGSNDPDSDEVALGDLDGDRDLDAIIANVIDDFDGDDEFSEVWLNDGRGNFSPHPTSPVSIRSATAMVWVRPRSP